MTEPVVVIGAGMSGLSYANWYLARRPGAQVVVLEAESEPGGYCRTVAKAGFVWDYSGHFFHFKDPAIEAWLRARMPGQAIRTVAGVRDPLGVSRYSFRSRRKPPPAA